jgi:outer membrane biosynthesis protein TonB
VAPAPPTPPALEAPVTSSTGTIAASSAPTGESTNPGGVGGVNATGDGDGAGLGNDTAGAHATYAPMPQIPNDLRRDVFQSVAIAHFIVLADGTVKVTLSEATRSPELNRIILAVLGGWRFFPAIKDGAPTDSEFDVRIPISVQ